MKILRISTRSYSYRDFAHLFNGPVCVTLTKNSLHNLKQSHKRLLAKINTGEMIYGVNTGFGNLSNIKIDSKDQKDLQLNLVRSHASGVGNPLELGLIRTVFVLKLLTYVKGYSGIRSAVAEKIVQFINHDILPVIPEKGSVGASGDLAPLGHMALALIGEGKVFYNGKEITTKTALSKVNIKPLVLQQKEGLSLINGTQVSTALAIKSLLDGDLLLKTADIAGALSVENSFASRKVFQKKIHALKKHPGQQSAARNVYKLLNGSKIVKSHSNCGIVQDPYSFRCIPHIHGASRDGFTRAANMIDNEINSVSDNPIVLENGDIVNSGHFHGEHVAQAMDFLAISFCELGAVSERRTHYFMKGVEGKFNLFVTKSPGVESGYMMAHVTASALVSENKTLAHPASVDSLPTSGGQEDLVSMAPWAGQKLLQIQHNLRHVLAVELLVAGAANQIASPNLTPGKGTFPILNILKSLCKYQNGDRTLSGEIESIAKKIKSGEFVYAITKNIILE
ncbi:MAG: histidine ammonia-lyase [Candidatus Marinimicrobia bacterium]|jgi:histidine ammonia-lyase|nr:histidine ammonia-lyase [Candidatus Neomarinimicrobiota bacterium]MBT3847951.1 histidine ammonia-lyase [Candidatus Neomarinimicrobiota bacterium]MBT4055386.1 histidine ammonia-lyase [Candidatus Neomarinimicrobiota bacterium]